MKGILNYMNLLPVKAVIFDMDGTLFDTERLSTQGWREAGLALGKPLPEELIASFRGNNDALITQKLSTHLTTEEEIQEAWRIRNHYASQCVIDDGVPPKPGLYSTLKALKGKGIRIALATSSDKERARNLCDLAGIQQFFDVSLYGTDITKSKPDPALYLLAAEKLQLIPEECLVVEDSFNGVRAGHAAGCRVAMIPDLDEPDDEIRGMCDAVLETLDGIVPYFLP